MILGLIAQFLQRLLQPQSLRHQRLGLCLTAPFPVAVGQDAVDDDRLEEVSLNADPQLIEPGAIRLQHFPCSMNLLQDGHLFTVVRFPL